MYIPGIYKQRDKTFFFFNYEGHRDHNAGNYAGTVPTPAFRTGDFSALLGPQIGTDALGRPILSGQIYDPFSTHAVGGWLHSRPCPGEQSGDIHLPLYGCVAHQFYWPKADQLLSHSPEQRLDE